MAGRQRGVLGIKKDPSKQMLFSFSAREGEEWPSDSDDTDYCPDSGDDTEVKQMKKSNVKVKKERNSRQLKGQRKSHPRRARPLNCDDDSNEKQLLLSRPPTDDIWGANIPPEILLLIFQHVVRQSGALPFLCRAGRVCRSWYETSLHQSLWTNVDLSFGWIKSTDQTLHKICSSHLTRTKVLNLQSWKNLTQTGIEVVAANCCDLESICLSYCTKLNSQALFVLAEQCPRLACLDLSFTSMQATQGKTLQQVIGNLGPNLKQLNFSGNKLNGFNLVLSAIWKNCPNLKSLEVCNATFSSDYASFDIERMQTGCPCLKVLRLGNSRFRAPHISRVAMESSKGFPDLEELSLAMDPANARDLSLAVDSNFIQRILKTSENLRLLDLRGCCCIQTMDMMSLVTGDLHQLYLSHISCQSLPQALAKWSSSLEEVELAWMKEQFMVGVVSALAQQASHLRTISLTGSSGIYRRDIEQLLRKCPSLHSLNLQSCRDLPRGMKQVYTTDGLDRLKEDILA